MLGAVGVVVVVVDWDLSQFSAFQSFNNGALRVHTGRYGLAGPKISLARPLPDRPPSRVKERRAPLFPGAAPCQGPNPAVTTLCQGHQLVADVCTSHAGFTEQSIDFHITNYLDSNTRACRI